MTLVVKIFYSFVLFTFAMLCLGVYRYPRESWMQLSTWQYKNPEAFEPSDDALLFQRLSAGFGFVASIGSLVFVIFFARGPMTKEEKARHEEEARKIAESVLPPPSWITPAASPTPSPTR